MNSKSVSEPALFDAALHEPLAGTAWNESAAREACDRIVAEALASFDPKLLWPCHPQDHEVGDAARTIGYTSLYLGAAGNAWALRRLTGNSPLDADALVAAFEAEPDMPDMRYGLLLGEVGVALVAHEFDPTPARADRPATRFPAPSANSCGPRPARSTRRWQHTPPRRTTAGSPASAMPSTNSGAHSSRPTIAASASGSSISTALPLLQVPCFQVPM